MKIGVILMLEGDATSAPRYRTIRELGQQAEQLGFDSIWIYDHLLFREERGNKGQWECFMMLGALAEATRRVELGTLVACTAFRNPALLAKMAETLDEISDGRFTLGLGAGWNKGEFDGFGYPYDHLVDRFEEALQIIVPLLREGRVTFEGRYERAHDCENVPRGPRTGRLPILIGAFGPRTLRIAARYADIVNTGFSLDEHPAGSTPVDQACRDVGRDPATLPVTFPGWVALPELGATPPHMHESQYRSVDDIVAYFRQNAARDVAELMIDLRPNTAEALDLLGEALRRFRAEQG